MCVFLSNVSLTFLISLKNLIPAGCLAFKAHNSPVKHESGFTHSSNKRKVRMSQSLDTSYNKLKDQCVDLLATKVNAREIGANFKNQKLKDWMIQELLLYEHTNLGTDKPMEVTKKKEIRSKIKRSPDTSDLFIMLMYPYLLDQGIIKPKPLEERKFTQRIRTKSSFV